MLRRRLSRLKRRRQRLAYHFRPREDARNKTARTLDLLVLVAICWLGTLVFLAQYWEIGLALPVSLILAAAGGAAASRFQEKQKQLRRQRYRFWLAGQRCREEIKKLQTREELTVFVSLLLAGLPQFAELQVNQKGGKKTLSVDEAIALRAKYKGVPVAVQCFPPAAEEREEVQLLRSFWKALEEQSLPAALIVAPGGLRPAARRIIAGLRKKYRVVVLYNEEKLVELALQAGRQPEAEDPRESAAGQKKYGYAAIEAIFEQKKGLHYLLAAGALWLIYLISPPGGLTGGLYLGLIAINVVLALACFLFNWRDEDLDLEDLEPET